MQIALILGLFFFVSVLAVCATAVHIKELELKQPEQPNIAELQAEFEKEAAKNKDVPTISDVIKFLNDGDWSSSDELGGTNNG